MKTVATAGHVDHGKSTLVLALTGTDPDRFPEEKTRGLTIDLGFAFTTLPSGREIGFVDVPGHVRFVKNMLAGVGAVEVALFVVAADEGWMPQSEEHLRILDLLGIRFGVVALSKSDVVDDETRAVARADVEEHLLGSGLEDAPIVETDARTGRGLDDLRAALDTVFVRAPDAWDRGAPRLWIDRAFAARGAGTVVTGTLGGGAVHVDDELQVVPGGWKVRVRGIEQHGSARDAVDPGGRVALNLVGIEHHRLHRGDAVIAPAGYAPTRVVDGRVIPLHDAPAPGRARWQAYVGSGEHAVDVRPLDDAREYARIRFGAALPLVPGDRLVLRDPATARTMCGVEVLDVRATARAAHVAEALAQPLGRRLVLSGGWIAMGEVAALTGQRPEQAVELLVDAGAIRAGSWLVPENTLVDLRRRAAAEVTDHHRAHPLESGIDMSRLARLLGIDPDRTRLVVDAEPTLAIDHGRVHATGRVARASETESGRALVARLDEARWTPPAPSDLGAPVALVKALVEEGALVEAEGVVFGARAFEAARDVLLAQLHRGGTLTVADARDALGSSRKYVLALLGRLDRTGITIRRGDLRVRGPNAPR